MVTDCAMTALIPESCRLHHIKTQSLWWHNENKMLRRNLQMIHNNLISYFIFSSFFIKSVSNWHQSEVWKKKLHFLSNHFQMYHSFFLLLLTNSSVWFSQSSLRRMQYLTGFSKHRNKTAEVSHPFKLKLKNKKQKAAFALVRLPQQGNKHSYDRSRPCVSPPGPRAMGTRRTRKESLLTKEHFLNVF